MTPEVRRAALRIAAKTALVVTVGCSGSSSPTIANTTPATPVAAPSCDAHLDALEVVEVGYLADGDPLKQKHDVYGAFADIVARKSARTQECCTEELIESSSQAEHRWGCCSALDNKVPAGATRSACSPWGPPCPPEMSVA